MWCHRASLVVGVAVVGLLLGGCPESGGPCKSHLDCPAEERCALSRCRVPCDETAECVEPLMCSGGICLELGRACMQAEDCYEPERCVDFNCRLLCQGSADCPSTLRCDDGICLAPDAG